MAEPARQLEPVRPVPHSAARRVELRDVLKGDREVILLHEGQEYRLRITANAKLILTK